MLKKTFLIIGMLVMSVWAHAQTSDDVYNDYADFNEACLNANTEKAMALGEKILPDTAKLTPQRRVIFYNFLAKLYEDDSQSIKAITYYNRVVAAQSNYYVAHRALGFLYIKDISGKPANQVVVDAAYINRIKKALPHLEKAQACEPDDQTLNLIKVLYRDIKDERDLNTLPARLTELKKNCVDLLSDQ
jgi:tetratricopeptide (TPR) repeat protein